MLDITKNVIVLTCGCGAACCCEKQGDLVQGAASFETDHFGGFPCAVDAVSEAAVLLGEVAVLPPAEVVGDVAHRLLGAARHRWVG